MPPPSGRAPAASAVLFVVLSASVAAAAEEEGAAAAASSSGDGDDAADGSSSSSSSSSSDSSSGGGGGGGSGGGNTVAIAGVTAAVTKRFGETRDAAGTARQENSILAKALADRLAALAATKDALAVREQVRRGVGKRRAELASRSTQLSRCRSALASIMSKEASLAQTEKGEDSASARPRPRRRGRRPRGEGKGGRGGGESVAKAAAALEAAKATRRRPSACSPRSGAGTASAGRR